MAHLKIAHGGRGIYPIVIGMIKKRRKKYICSLDKVYKRNRHTLSVMTLPDRVLYIANGSFKNTLEQKADTFDEIITLDPWSDNEVRKDLELDYYMGNFVGDPRTASSDIKLIWDSGGLQLFRGGTDFLDPRDIGKQYKEADIHAGVTLDLIVPKYISNYARAAKFSASIQRRNTELLQEAAPKVKVLNMIHGYTSYSRDIWLDNCYTPKISTNWCLADLSRVSNVTERAYFMLKDMLDLQKMHDLKKIWVHVLGVAMHKFILIMVPLAPFLGRMTSDATTALAASMHGTMLLPSIGVPQKSYYIGRLPDSGGTALPCSCPVCSIVGNSWVYSKFNIPLAFHNVCISNKWTNTLNHVFEYEGIQGYVKYLQSVHYPMHLLELVEKVYSYMESKTFPEYIQGADTLGFNMAVVKSEKRFWGNIKKYIEFYQDLEN
jgi:hypothetical protein